MRTPNYTYYVTQCMKYYTNNDESRVRTEVERQNWKSCEEALKQYSRDDREALLTIYRNNDTISNSICKLANNSNYTQDYLWKKVRDLEKQIAVIRGLV